MSILALIWNTLRGAVYCERWNRVGGPAQPEASRPADRRRRRIWAVPDVVSSVVCTCTHQSTK